MPPAGIFWYPKQQERLQLLWVLNIPGFGAEPQSERSASFCTSPKRAAFQDGIRSKPCAYCICRVLRVDALGMVGGEQI